MASAKKAREVRDDILAEHEELARSVARGEASEEDTWALTRAVIVANMMDSRAANSTQALMAFCALEKSRRDFARHLLDGQDGTKANQLKAFLVDAERAEDAQFTVHPGGKADEPRAEQA